jgi:hypothetical protein
MKTPRTTARSFLPAFLGALLSAFVLAGCQKSENADVAEVSGEQAICDPDAPACKREVERVYLAEKARLRSLPPGEERDRAIKELEDGRARWEEALKTLRAARP